MKTPKLLLKTLRFLAEALDALFLVGVVVEAVPPLVAYFRGGRYIIVIEPVRARLEALARPLAAFIEAHLPHTVGKQDMTPYMVAVVFFGVSSVFTRIARRLRVEILAREQLEKAAEAEEAARRSGYHEKLAELEAAKETDREKVLEVYAKAKALLEERKREVAFLAVDVVGSTAMKQGEDPALAERDFGRYRKLVESAFQKRGVLKSAWTPDGVMACFPDLAAAVGAGQDLLQALPAFNKTEKSIKADFAVRCGVNAGAVLYDFETPMEKMSDGAIDVAGHMQKHAESGTIYAARSVLGECADEWGFRAADGKVDGFDVAVWSPR